MLLREVIKYLFWHLTAKIANATNPQSLKKYSLDTIKDNIQDVNVYKVSKKLFPQIFHENIPLEFSGFNSIFFKEMLDNKEVDLSHMNLERIPIILAKRMKKIEKLNLSYNSNWNLNEEWFAQFFKVLKELSIRSCKLNDSIFETIDKLEMLENIDISGNEGLDVNSPHFISVIKRLKHLSISYCRLNENDLKTILKYATELESLNFSENELHRGFDVPPGILRNLKVLKLSGCGLEARDLPKIFSFENLKEINLSHNDFSGIDSALIQDIFFFSNYIDVASIKSLEINQTQKYRKNNNGIESIETINLSCLVSFLV